MFDDFLARLAYHPVFRPIAYNPVPVLAGAFPETELLDTEAPYLCFVLMMLYNLMQIATPKALGTISLRC